MQGLKPILTELEKLNSQLKEFLQPDIKVLNKAAGRSIKSFTNCTVYMTDPETKKTKIGDVITALCEDNTLWRLVHWDQVTAAEWYQIHPILTEDPDGKEPGVTWSKAPSECAYCGGKDISIQEQSFHCHSCFQTFNTDDNAEKTVVMYGDPKEVIKFREHRGGLADSLATTVELPRREMVDHIFLTYAKIKFNHVDGRVEKPDFECMREKLASQPYGNDQRAWGDTFLITYDGDIVGFTDKPV